MEKLKRITLAGTVLLSVLLAACEFPTSAASLPTIPVPAATLTPDECFSEKDTINSENISECALKKDVTFAETKELRQIIESDIVPNEFKDHLLEPVINAEKLAQNGELDLYAFKAQGSYGLSRIGCSEDKPFHSFVIVPEHKESDPAYPEDAGLDIRWHEFEHVSEAYKRFLAGETCPFDGPLSEQTEVDYWGRYIEAVARRNGISSESTTLLKGWGIDLPEVVYQVLIPLNIESNSNLYKFLMQTGLLRRFIYINSSVSLL